jgi:site-specific DNA-methyltransferase (adenine-specific)
MSAELLHGDYFEALAERAWDTAILDLPYSRRTHDGHAGANEAAAADGMFPNVIEYDSIDPVGVAKAVDFLAPRTSGWLVSQTSHDLIPAWEERLEHHGRYVFAPIPYVHMGKSPRVVGDGPASWTVFMVVSRPRSKAWLVDWRERRRALGLPRSLHGAYLRSPGDTVYRPEGGKALQGAKPLGVMRAIVRDYSFPGEAVCDPSAGHGTTPLAAVMEDRQALACEIDEATHAEAQRRLGLGHTRDMFASLAAAPGWTA